MIDILLTKDDLSMDPCYAFVADPSAGGISIFVGAVRDLTKGKEVIRLEFEAYEAMAKKEMRKIAQIAIDKFKVKHIAIHHRSGILQIGEIPVIIAVSSAHRKEAFLACEFCIDELKRTVPIWKKEIFKDGEIWVSAHP